MNLLFSGEISGLSQSTLQCSETSCTLLNSCRLLPATPFYMSSNFALSHGSCHLLSQNVMRRLLLQCSKNIHITTAMSFLCSKSLLSLSSLVSPLKMHCSSQTCMIFIFEICSPILNEKYASHAHGKLARFVDVLHEYFP